MTPPLCPRCGRPSPGSNLLGGACAACLLEFAFAESPEEEPTPEPEPTPSQVGSYTILDPLGRGGMGTVYSARHNSLDRVIALKIFHPDCARQPGFPARFRREAQVLASLAHPHILQVHDLGCDAGTYFLAMEKVEGQTLRQRLQKGPLPLREVEAIFEPLCRALEHAHEHGVIHRDIKPENILLDATGVVKVGDFGIAKLLDDEKPLTSTGQMVGTRSYMAPEQVRGSGDVDRRTDVYAMGVVLYEMLTGELPLGVFAPVSAKVDVGTSVDAVIMRALANEPPDRFASIAELREAFHGAVHPARPRRLGWLVAGVVAAFVIACVGYSWRPSDKPHTGDEVVLQGHSGPVHCVAFSRDGKLVASASEDRSVRVWSAESGEPMVTLPLAFPGEEFGPVAVVFLNDGKRVLTAGRENLLRIWDLEKAVEIATLRGHSREINALALSPDGKTAASASLDQTIRLWDLESKKSPRKWDVPMHPALSLAFSPDATHLAAGLMSGAVLEWDAQTGAALPSSMGHIRRVRGLTYAPDGMLASGSHDRTIKLRPQPSPPVKTTVLPAHDEVWALAFSPDGGILASGGLDGIIRFWDPHKFYQFHTLIGHQQKVLSLAFSPSGSRLASASADGTVRLWDSIRRK